jgi:C-terminal processing protease CtpA/Prc
LLCPDLSESQQLTPSGGHRVPTVRKSITLVALAIVSSWVFAAGSPQQKINKADRDKAHQVLHDAYDAVKKNYYDPKYHDVNLDALFSDFDAKIDNAASFGDALGMVAAFFEALKDVHTRYNPPPPSSRTDYGYRMQMIGDDCFITRVRPATDAETKVHPGDQVMAFSGYSVTHADFNRILYYFNLFSPQPAIKLGLRDPAGNERETTVLAKVQDLKSAVDLSEFGGTDPGDPVREGEYRDHTIRQRMVEMGDVAIWKMPEFRMKDGEVDGSFATIRKHKTLILDLRGNPGGALPTLARLVGSLFDHDVKIADRQSRKESKPQIAKTRGVNAFTGKLVVLVDNESASAAELFARVVQIEHRGTVIGDRTAGAVMETKHYVYSQGLDSNGAYDFTVTDADLIMSDGKSLESTGVVPDEIVLPSGADLAAGRDPVLAHAAELAGSHLDPLDAGKLFPIEWTRF